MLYAVIAILLFGFLIAVHEFGHFVTAKLSGVHVNEFAIGMGPVLWQKQGKAETVYSLRAFPIGGFCALEGEDAEEETSDPHAFGNQSFIKQFIILIAGSAMNFLTGLVLMVLLLSQNWGFYVPVIGDLFEGFPLESEQGLMEGDRILFVNGDRVFTYSEMVTFLQRAEGEPMDIVVQRNGEKVHLNDLPLARREYVIDGQTMYKFGITPVIEEATPTIVLRESLYNTIEFARLVWLSLGELVSGSAGLEDMSGPIGIVETVTEVGQQAEDRGGISAGIRTVVYFLAFIAVNLAVMNLLPIPALDGGRIFFLMVGLIYRLFTGQKLDPKYESFINPAGFIALLALMAIIAFNDIAHLVG